MLNHHHHFDPYDIDYEPQPLWLMLLGLVSCVALVVALVLALL